MTPDILVYKIDKNRGMSRREVIAAHEVNHGKSLLKKTLGSYLSDEKSIDNH